MKGLMRGRRVMVVAVVLVLMSWAGQDAYAGPPLDAAPQAGEDQSPKAVLHRAYALISANQFPQAIEILQRLIAATPKPIYAAKAHGLMGQAYCGLGSYREAIVELEIARSSACLPDSKRFEASLDLMRAVYRSGDADRAQQLRDDIRTAYFGPDSPVAKDPDHFLSADKAQWMFASALAGIGMKDDALAISLISAGSSNRYEQRAALLGARILEAQGRPAEAVHMLENAAGKAGSPAGPGSAGVYRELVSINLRAGQTNAALGWMEDGVHRLTNAACAPGYLYSTARILREHSVAGWEDVMDGVAYSSAQGIRMTALEDLASDAQREGDWQKAQSLQQKLLSLPERTPAQFAEDYLNLAKSLHAQGKDTKPVVASLVSFLEKATPSDGAILLRIGKVLEELGRDDAAELAYRKEIVLVHADARGRRAHLRLAEMLCRNRRYDEAVAEYWEYIDQCHAAGDSIRAMKGLVMLAQSPAARASAKLGNLDIIAESDALQIQDEQALCDVAVFLAKRNRDGLAVMCVRRACRLADRHAAAGALTPVKRMDVEQKLVRRLTELRLYKEAISRADAVPKNIVTDSSVTLETRSDLAYYRGRALLLSGSPVEARRAFEGVLKDVKNDSRLDPAYAAAAGVDMLAIDAMYSASLFRRAASQERMDVYGALANLFLAIDEMKNGRNPEARTRLEKARRATSEDAALEWQRQVHWNVQYLQGVLRKRMGEPGGPPLMEEAQAHATIWNGILQGTDARPGSAK